MKNISNPPQSANTAMKADIKQKIEEWCDWACGDLPRTSDKWKAANLGAIKGASLMQEEVDNLQRDKAYWQLEANAKQALIEEVNQTIKSRDKEIESLKTTLEMIRSTYNEHLTFEDREAIDTLLQEPKQK